MTQSIPANLVAQTWSRPLQRPGAVPGAADVVIIGGGIIGVSTAWFLARQGVRVALCEKGHIAGEQSGRNWGWVRQQGRDVREMPMIIESLQIWRTLADELEEDVGFRQTGSLFAARREREFEDYSAWVETARQHGLDTRIVSAREIERLVQGAAVDWKGGIHTASDGCAEPHKATSAIARAAAREGASILTACAVRGIETEGGRVSAAVTEHGTIRTSAVLCAAGAWAALFCRSLGITLPQLKVHGTVARTAPAARILDGNVWDERLGIRRREDGGYTVADDGSLRHFITPSTLRFAFKFLPALRKEIRTMNLASGRSFLDEWRQPTKWALDEASPFEATRVLDPRPDPRSIAGIRKSLSAVLPPLADADIVEAWCGVVETMPDVVPVIDESDLIPGFYIATGFSGHGFGIGPGAGRVMADMVLGKPPAHDLDRFRFSRFADGTPMRPGPGL